MDLNKAFKAALDFEEKGRRIYLETAEKTNNPIVAKTFRYLAEQEVNHIEEIKKYMDNHEIELKGDRLEDTKKFFTTTTSEFKEMTELSKDDMKARETALELEQKSYGFYKQQHDAADDPKLKKFFKFLMEQENAHYTLIQNAYNFLKNPGHAYAEDEKWVMEG